MQREFIQYPALGRLIVAGAISDEQLKIIENDIMDGAGDVIANTGGIKKLRCPGKGKGKRGGWRVCFVDYPKYGVVVLITAFAKSVKTNLSLAERRVLKKVKRQIDEEVELSYGRER